MRAQANLAAFAVALVFLTGATVLGVVVADAALADAVADSDPLERHAASGVADRLTAADGPVAVRSNALGATAVDDLNASRLDDVAPPAAGRDVRVALDGTAVVERGSPAAGTTVRRSVVVVSRAPPTRDSIDLSDTGSLRVPRGVDRATVRVDSGPNTTVRTVRANGRVVLHDEAGLGGSATVPLSRFEPTTLRVETGGNATGRAVVSYRRRRAVDRILTVTVDA